MPTATDNARLWEVGKRYGARAILLAEWKRGSQVTLRRLGEDLKWSTKHIEPGSIFAPKKVSALPKANQTVAVKARIRRIVGS